MSTDERKSRAKARGSERSADTAVQHPGELTRALRQRHGMTLDELATLSGISKGHLSRFERGEKTVSVSALMRVAQALHTSAAGLLGEQVDKGVMHLVRASERHYRKERGADYDYAPLSRVGGGDGPTALLLRMTADTELKEAAYHSGDEIFYVLSGAIEIELADQSIILREGDFLQFPGLVKHRVRNLGDEAQVLVVVTGTRDE